MRRSILTLVTATIAAVIAFTPASALAQTSPTTRETLATALTQARSQCLGAAKLIVGATPNAEKAVNDLIDLTQEASCAPIDIKPPAKVDESALTFSKVSEAVDDELKQAWKDYGCDQRAAAPSCQAIQAAKIRQEDLRLIKQGKVAALPPGRYNRANNTLWSTRTGSFGTAPGIGISFLRLVLEAVGSDIAQRAYPDTSFETILRDMKTAKDNGASDAPCRTQKCGEEVAQIISLYPLLEAVDTGFMLVTVGNFDKTIEFLDKRVARWDAYHFGGGQGRAQLPWELAVNGFFYQRSHHAPNAPINETTPLDDIWRSPPNRALTLLHPSAGLAMKDVKGASLVVSAVEIVGISRWDYDDKTQSRTNEWGISALAAYRARDDAKNWGYGVLVRTPLELSSLPINIVWTRTKLNAGGHDDTVALSVDISRYVPKWKNAACLFKLPSCEKGS